MPRKTFNPDLAQRDDGPFWAAALVLAIRDGDKARADLAREHLRRLGYRVELAADVDRKGESNVTR